MLLVSAFATRTSANIGVFPQSVDFDDSSKKRSQTLNVVNHSDHPQTYRVSVIQYTQDEDGKYTEVETAPNAAAKYLVFSPKQFTIRPGKIQAVRIARKSLGQLKDGEYVSHIKISEVEMPKVKTAEDEKKAAEAKKAAEEGNNEEAEDEEETERQLSFSLKTLFAMSIPVTIYKGNNLEQKTSIESVKVNGDKVDVVLKRQGQISSRVNVVVLDTKGNEIGRNGPLRIYTPNGKRNVSVQLDKEAKTKPAIIRLENAVTKKEILQKQI